eukprot:4014824-Amphidinium_carterae.1
MDAVTSLGLLGMCDGGTCSSKKRDLWDCLGLSRRHLQWRTSYLRCFQALARLVVLPPSTLWHRCARAPSCSNPSFGLSNEHYRTAESGSRNRKGKHYSAAMSL